MVECVGVLRRPGGLRGDQLDPERVCKPANDLVLQSEEIFRVTVEPLRPEMRVGPGVDQLCRDANRLPDSRTLPSST